MSIKPILLTSKDIYDLLPMEQAIKVMRDAFIAISSDTIDVPQRIPLSLSEHNGTALLMPAYSKTEGVMTLKTVVVSDDNPNNQLPRIHANLQLIDASNGKLLAIMDAEALTAIRTGAGSGVATDTLAKKNASSLLVIGCGAQGKTQALAVASVRSLKKIEVYDSNLSKAESFALELSRSLTVPVRVCENIQSTYDADIIVTATNSNKPVVSFDHVKPGTHINGVGSYKPTMRELPTDLIENAFLVVDSQKAALTEAGDILIPIEEGRITSLHIQAELGKLLTNQKALTKKVEDITVFKSVGHAAQDLFAAVAVYRSAIEKNIGKSIEL